MTRQLYPLAPVGYVVQSACLPFSGPHRLGVLGADFCVDEKKLFRSNSAWAMALRETPRCYTRVAWKEPCLLLGSHPANGY
jgi:hypothetical protein